MLADIQCGRDGCNRDPDNFATLEMGGAVMEFWYNDQYGEWPERADSQWEADIEAAVTRAERDAKYQAHNGEDEDGSGDFREAHKQAMQWHNKRISEGSDPRSGLRTLPHVPDEGPASGPTWGGVVIETSQRVLYTQGGARQPDVVKRKQKNGGGCLVIATIMALVGVCLWAVVYSTIGG